MLNNDLEYARRYHDVTKHSEFSVRMSHHYIYWHDRPRPFKVYTDLPSIPLPRNFPLPDANPLYCISSNDGNIGLDKRESRNKRQDQLLNISSLAEILFFSAGITRKIKHGSDTYYMRAASATGALYPIELYVVCGDMLGLSAGVYHFCPADFSLDVIRTGDYTSYLEASVGEQRRIGLASVEATSSLAIVFTSIVWRNAWKYSLRSYRHWFWDAGVIAANLLAVASCMKVHPRLRLGFIDSAIDSLLCLENEKEATVAIATLDYAATSTNSVGSNDDRKEENINLQKIESKHTPMLPLSRREHDLPQIWKIQQASALISAEQVVTWTGSYYSKLGRKMAEPKSKDHEKYSKGKSYPLSLQNVKLADNTSTIQQGSIGNLGDVILQRGSTRQFARTSISFDQLSIILWCSTRGVPLDFLKPGDSLIDIYLVANAVEGLNPGGYFFDRSTDLLEQLGGSEGRGKDELAARYNSAYLCLEQPLFGDAAVVFFLMADLEDILQSMGNRGYRCAQFEAGVIAGKLYLASYALGIGASGSTFYDNAVTEYFSPHASAKDTMIAVGVGYPAYKAPRGKILTGILTKDQLMSMYDTGVHK